MRLRLQQQQQLMQQQQAAAQQQAVQQLPSQAELLARVQAMHPQLTHEQAQIQAQKQLAHYHEQLRNNMTAQVRRPQGGVRAGGTGGTGVLIGANGPIGPGAAQLQAQQQQQQAQQQQQSRSVTPVVMQGQQVQSPGVPQPPQQQMPQETPTTQ
jgi:uncharacterized protein with von Willebrand factor type A (vWA) domain